MKEEQYQRVCQAALLCLDDMNGVRNMARNEYQKGRITKKEYITTMNHYKHLRDALWHAGYNKEVDLHMESKNYTWPTLAWIRDLVTITERNEES